MGHISMDSSLMTHEKLFRLQSNLRVGRSEAVGLLACLWLWCVDRRPDGDLKDLTDAQIAFAAEWSGDGKLFVRACVDAGFLKRADGSLFVHDWNEWMTEATRSKVRRSTDKRPETDRIPTKKEKKEGVPSASSLSPTPPISSSVSPNPERKETITRVKKSEAAMPFWQQMVDHLDATWLRKKKTKFFWRGQHFKHLRSLANLYQPWGVMALWDAFMGSQDDWVRTTGYSFEAFCSHIPKLVDDSFWKIGSKRYEEQLNGPMPVIPNVLKTAVS